MQGSATNGTVEGLSATSRKKNAPAEKYRALAGSRTKAHAASRATNRTCILHLPQGCSRISGQPGTGAGLTRARICPPRVALATHHGAAKRHDWPTAVHGTNESMAVHQVGSRSTKPQTHL